MPITDEELKDIFRANDYTTYKPQYDPQKASAAENKIHRRAKALFYDAWCNQLADMGGKPSLVNFSRDYPVKLLEQVDEGIVAEKIVEIWNDEAQRQAAFEIFFTAMEKSLE